MIRTSGALSGALILAACSGGGGTVSGGGGSTTPSPTPTATASPTPTPSPSPTYTKYADLTGDRTFPSSCTVLITNQSPPNLGSATLPGQGLSFAYTAAAQSWAVTGDGVNLNFGPGDVDPASPASGQFYLKAGAGGTDRLRIQQAGITGVGPLEYARIVSVITNVGGQPRNYTCIIGTPTLVTDVPAATSVTYRAAYGGSAYVTPIGGGATTLYSLGKTGVSLDANRTTGKVTLSLHLIGTPIAGGADVDFGTVTGTADIDPATGAYYGTSWTGTTPTVSFGQFSGRFYGPQGLETELAITLIADSPSGTPPISLRTSGSVIGIR